MKLKIGELLIKNGLLTTPQLEQALVAQRTYGGKLGTNLMELGFVTDQALAQFLSKQLNIPAATSKDFDSIPKAILNLLPPEMAEKHRIIPLRLDKKFVIAMSDPSALPVTDELAFKAGKPIQPVIAPEVWILAALERYYGIRRSVRYVNMEEPTFAGWDTRLLIGGTINIDGENVEEGDLRWHSLIGQLVIAKTKEEIFSSLMDFLAPIFPRTAIYIARKDHISGWMLRGFPIHISQFQKIEMLRSAESTFQTVLEEQKAFVGELPVKKNDLELLRMLGFSSKQLSELHPISFRGKGVAILLGVPDLGQPSIPKTADMVRQACARSGLGLELAAIRKTIQSPFTPLV